MAFPQVADATNGAETSNVTTHVLTYPSTLAENDQLLAFMSFDGNPTDTWPSEWTSLGVSGGTVRFRIMRFRPNASQASTLQGTTFNVTTGAASEQSVWRIVRITGAHTTTNPAISAVATATSVNPNSATLTPSWSSEDTLWYSAFGQDDGRRSMSVIPTNYGNEFYDTSNGPAGCALGTSRRELNTAGAEDPSAYTISSSHVWRAFTVAVRPAPEVTPVPKLSPVASFVAVHQSAVR